MADKKVIIILLTVCTNVFGYHDQSVFYLHQPFCKESVFELTPKSNCTGFYICANGRTYEETCQDGWVYSHGAHGCVPRGSFIDDCEMVTERCAKDPSGIFQHGLECQLYYNCSNNNSVEFYIYRGAAGGLYITEPFLQECPFPQLFNVHTLACDDFENVSCGTRNEIVAQCKYWAYKSYYGNRGRPCIVDYPSCEGLPDGKNRYPDSAWTSRYLDCFKGRTNGSGYCPSLNVSDIPNKQLFHPQQRKCLPLYKIPKYYGGYMPDCSDLPDGDYPIDFGSCRYYFVCVNRTFVDVYVCPDGLLFDYIFRVCVDESTAKCNP